MTNLRGQSPVDPKEVLDKILATNFFKPKSRQWQLLSYLIDGEYSNDSDLVSEYSIALDVLGRGSEFDPQTDSIVRAEMHRLRNKLSVFNAKYSGFCGFEIAIPSKTFSVKISRLDKASSLDSTEHDHQKKSFQFLKLTGFAGIVIMLIIGANLLGKSQNQSHIIPNEHTFRQTISVNAMQTAEDLYTNQLMRQISNGISYNLSQNERVLLVEDNDINSADYTIDLSTGKFKDGQVQNLYVFVYTKDGKSVLNKTYVVPANHSERSISDFSHSLYVDIFDLNGPLTRFHVFNPEISFSRRDLYKCSLDATSITLPNSPRYFKGDLLDCLSPESASVSQDKGYLHTKRADIMLLRAMKTIDSNERLSFIESAGNELQKAKYYSYQREDYFTILLRFEAMKKPRDYLALRNAMSEYGYIFANSPLSYYVRAEMESRYFGDWEKALKLADEALTGLETKPTVFHDVYFNYHVVHGNWQDAKSRLEFLSPGSGPSTLIRRAAYACGAKDVLMQTSIKEQLLADGITSGDEFVHWVKTLRYDKTLESAYLSEVIDKNCSIFEIQ